MADTIRYGGLAQFAASNGTIRLSPSTGAVLEVCWKVYQAQRWGAHRWLMERFTRRL